MADGIIKKARILNSNLPTILSEINGYLIRYRVKSSDQNRVSHWSPFIFIDPEYLYLPGKLENNSGNQILNLSWDAVKVLKPYETKTDITNRSLTSNIATITTSSAHYMNVGDYVTVSNVSSIFNGTYVISAVTTTPTHTFSYYKDNGDVTSGATSGSYTKNYIIKNGDEYDVWLRWDRSDGGDWIYKERIQGTSISFPHQSTYTINGAVQSSGPNRVSVEIYMPGNPPSREDGAPGTPPLKVYRVLDYTI